MQLTDLATAVIEPALFAAFLIMVRMLGLTMAVPRMGPGTFGVPTRILIVTLLTVVCWSALGMPVVALPTHPFTAGIMLVREFVIGLALGLFLQGLFALADVAGAVVGMQMSLSMAGMVDPATGQQTTAVTSLLGIASMLIFVVLGGHHEVIKGLWANLHLFPIGQDSLVGITVEMMEHFGQAVFVAGIQIAAPVVVVSSLINVGLGLMARAAPQMNIFAIGFSVLLCVGMVLLDTTVMSLHEAFDQRIPTLAEDMNSLMQPIGHGQ